MRKGLHDELSVWTFVGEAHHIEISFGKPKGFTDSIESGAGLYRG
jgi:hypothetical protein